MVIATTILMMLTLVLEDVVYDFNEKDERRLLRKLGKQALLRHRAKSITDECLACRLLYYGEPEPQRCKRLATC